MTKLQALTIVVLLAMPTVCAEETVPAVAADSSNQQTAQVKKQTAHPDSASELAADANKRSSI